MNISFFKSIYHTLQSQFSKYVKIAALFVSRFQLPHWFYVGQRDRLLEADRHSE
jgi:hypothetical protein